MLELQENEELISDNIHIIGDVHTQTIIDAIDLKVEGTTHAGSTQYVKNATIFTHQGLLRCHNANVTLLDGGEIHASHAVIDTCKSGSIYAQSVKIKNLNSNIKVCASKFIIIEHIHGLNNVLTIDYKQVPILISKLELINEDVEDLEKLLLQAQEENLDTQDDIEDELKHLKNEEKEIKNSVHSAKISITKKIMKANVLSFVTQEDQVISYTPEQNQEYKPFSLEFTKDFLILHPVNLKTLRTI
ncbi:hypothetical protein JHD48_01360 [Sulfurimonas sp. SAG-AH-194-I05]|nr:hypothetical protein [Sulfurimonas sp. SAG-AH-194-I05]MDF1874377.1 hypothetical protein [Sulfurimonas sp. SAG-AH-194-I05]